VPSAHSHSDGPGSIGPSIRELASVNTVICDATVFINRCRD
jgi:hypothetical protein